MDSEPIIKKMKFEDNNDRLQDIEWYIKQIETSKKNLDVVLDDKLSKPIPLLAMYAGNIKNAKDISKTIKILNEKIPLNDLSHLKRVRNNTILICPATVWNDVNDFVQTYIPELCDIFESFNVLVVPQYAPKLKRQHKEVNRIWSCNFHPDAYLERLCSNNFFSNEGLTVHRLYMSVAFQAALWHIKKSRVENITKEIFAKYNACVVVDPNICSIVAVAFDNSRNHPVQHSAMVAIDNVSKTQYGGAWGEKNQGTDCSLHGIDEGLLLHLKEQFPDVKFGAQGFKNKEDLLLDDQSISDSPYLCTNYYLYLLREPCLMCAMGLVHARVKRLFFCYDNPTFGALYSKTKLHTVSSLNHRYEVFTGFL